MPTLRPLIDHWCRRCGTKFESPHPRHLYCEPCSGEVYTNRKRLLVVERRPERDRQRKTGRLISATEARSIADPVISLDLAWLVKITVPFQWAGSKNATYSIRGRGGSKKYLALTKEVVIFRDSLIWELRQALRDQKIARNKLWLEIFVEKSSHRGDAVNFVDTVCDAVKVATGLDDRWFSIRRLDWSVNKNAPKLIIGIGQEHGIEDAQVCSYCGRVLGLDQFGRNRTTKLGRGRICRDCKKVTLHEAGKDG